MPFSPGLTVWLLSGVPASSSCSRSQRLTPITDACSSRSCGMPQTRHSVFVTVTKTSSGLTEPASRKPQTPRTPGEAACHATPIASRLRRRPRRVNRLLSSADYGIDLPDNLADSAVKLVDDLAGASPASASFPVGTVVISGDGAGDQTVGSPEVNVLVGWMRVWSAPTGGQAKQQVVAQANRSQASKTISLTRIGV